MILPEPLKFTVGGFSPKRVGYALALVSFALVPAHSYVSCEASGAINCIGVILFLITSLLSLTVQRGTPHRFRPLAWAFIAVVAHTLCVH
jgi:hypothetical protein